jgi:iron complex outermembrane receptor protein
VKLKKLTQIISLICIAGPVVTHQAVAQASDEQKRPQSVERVIITGSSIKRVETEGALPIQIITRQEIDRQGITSAEQLMATLSSSGNGMDNLASNSDVVAGQERGNNGASAANLRGQGSASTLVLLNGRRMAAHGLNGGIVDLNSIPFAIVDRVEILKDGASAIYGTDAIGGVINFILRKDFTGVSMEASTDKTQAGGGDRTRIGLLAGMGDLAKDGYNVMVGLGHTDSKILRGDQRDFVNTFQPDRGLSVDTRGTPYATVFPLASANAAVLRTILSSRATPTGPINNTLSPIQPGTTLRINGGINPLDLPGGAGCNSIDGMGVYDEVLWATPAAKYACAWDTGRAAALQQPIKTDSVVARAAFNAGNHVLSAEFTGSKADSAKSFSNNQISSSTTASSVLFNLVYPSTGSSYNQVFNSLVAVFPSIEENRGQGIAYRWRCMECGRRELTTTSETARLLLAAEGTIGSWDYRAGVSQAYSDTRSTIGGGYYYDDMFVPLLASGTLNPFLLPGQSQTPAALAALEAASARGVVLYGGKFTLDQIDASASGAVYKLPAGDVMAAVGTEFRSEKWKFNGDQRTGTVRTIFNVPFDNVNALSGVKRDIKAVYAEVQVPVIKSLDVTVAGRQDNYTGFGNTFNPKISARFVPVEQVLMRASYSTGFRVPTFNQLFNGITDSPTSGATIVDPTRCPAKVVSATPGCEAINPNTLSGGKSTLGPEESKQASVGFVVAPTRDFSANIDWWHIKKTGTIQAFPIATMIANYDLFPENFIRNAAGNIAFIDIRPVNAGETSTKGVDVGAKLNGALFSGKYSAAVDGSYLIEKKSRLLVSAPFGPSEIATFTRSGDLGLRWKHAASFTYTQGDWSGTLYQFYSSGYKDAVLPGVANGSVVPPNWNPHVESYTTYHASVTYKGIKNLSLTAGIKNLFDQDPPFSAAYDTNTGAGSSWEPRVADPRGRSFTLLAKYTFF